MSRLTKISTLPDAVQLPAYSPENHGAGIVHLGLGAFHKAHQAVYTDTALGVSGGDWRIIGVSLRSATVTNELTPQDGRYTLIVSDKSGAKPRIIASIAQAIFAGDDRQSMLDALTDPATKIVSLTVTEKGYGIDRKTGGIDTDHPSIVADLKTPDTPTGALGLIVWALRERRKNDVPAFTVLCCDNLPDNGAMVRGGVIDFARQTDSDLADWIAENVAFPATMVDRITPAKTDATLALAKNLTGYDDQAAIETEPFTQWVIEDNFPTGRPNWEAGGALFVTDVTKFENMKLRMLNGTHSMLAYAGFLGGHPYIRDTMANDALKTLAKRHLNAAAATLDRLESISFDDYAADLITRFENPEIAHQTYQIAMDGSEKLPQRILTPALAALDQGQPLRPFAFATAAWMRYCLGQTDDKQAYVIQDPLANALAQRVDGLRTAPEISGALFDIASIFPTKLTAHQPFTTDVNDILTTMLDLGMSKTIEKEAKVG